MNAKIRTRFNYLVCADAPGSCTIRCRQMFFTVYHRVENCGSLRHGKPTSKFSGQDIIRGKNSNKCICNSIVVFGSCQKIRLRSFFFLKSKYFSAKFVAAIADDVTFSRLKVDTVVNPCNGWGLVVGADRCCIDVFLLRSPTESIPP